MKIAADLGYRAVAIDLPPFGYSTRPTSFDYTRRKQAERIVATLDRLQTGKIVIVAHSFGAGPAITAAARMPEKILALALIDPALGFTTPNATTVGDPPWIARLLLGVLPLRLVLADVATHPAMMKTAVQRVIYKKEMATDEVVAVYQKQMFLQGKSEEMGKWIADFLLVRDAELIEEPQFFRRIPAPVTLVWGDRDDITPLWQGEKLMKLLPNAKLTVIPGVGHMPQIEDPPGVSASAEGVLDVPLLQIDAEMIAEARVVLVVR